MSLMQSLYNLVEVSPNLTELCICVPINLWWDWIHFSTEKSPPDKLAYSTAESLTASRSSLVRRMGRTAVRLVFFWAVFGLFGFIRNSI